MLRFRATYKSPLMSPLFQLGLRMVGEEYWPEKIWERAEILAPIIMGNKG
jgi:hypothetical protein